MFESISSNISKTRLVLFWLAFFCISGSFAKAAGWVSPDGYIDPTGKWRNETSAYDGSSTTYAEDRSNRTGYGQWIYLTLSQAIDCGRIRINADYISTDVRACDIDVLVDGVWVNVHEGAIANADWEEITFTAGSVTQARIRYNYRSRMIYWIYEFEFYENPPAVLAPTCSTEAATSIEETSATIHGAITSDGGEPCQMRFQYGTSTNYEYSTAWSGSSITGASANSVLTGLTNGVTYHYRVQAMNSAGIGSGSDMTFTTGMPGTGWVSPTGTSDPYSEWEDYVSAYDDGITTCARSYHDIGDARWGNFFYLTHDTMVCDGVRIFARGPSDSQYYVQEVDIDVLRDGVWTDVIEGSFTDMAWNEYYFAVGDVSQARVRFRTNSTQAGLYRELYEFDFHRIATVNISGAHDGTTPVSIAINGAMKGTYTGPSPYSFSVNVGTGDRVLVYYNNNTTGNDGAIVTTTDGSDMTGLDLVKNRLIVRSDNGGSITNTDLADAGIIDTDLPYTYSGSDITTRTGMALEIASGQSYDTQGNSLTIYSDLTCNGTFTAGSGTLTAAGTTAISGTSELTLNNLTISGSLTAPASNLNINGALVNNGTFTHSSGSVTFGAGASVSGTSTTTLNNITLNGSFTAPSGTMNIAGNLVCNGSLNGNSGTIAFTGTTVISGSTAPAFNSVSITGSLTAPATTMSVSGNWTKTGTFVNNSGTVEFTGTGTSVITGNTVFNNLSCEAAGKRINFTTGSTQTVNGALTFSGSSGSLITLRSTTGGIWYLSLPNSAQSVTYVDVAYSTALTNSVTVSGGVNSGNNTNWIFNSSRYWVGRSGNWSDTAHWSLSSGGAGGASVPTSANMAIFNSASRTGTCTINQTVNVAGLLMDTGNTMTIAQGANVINIGLGGYTQKGGTFTGSTGAIDNNGSFALSSGAFTSTSASMLLNGSFNHTGGTFTHNSGVIDFDGTCTIPGSQATVFGGITVSGSLTSPAALYVSRDFINNGTFSSGTGTVYFTGASAISGTSTTRFNNISISGTLTAPSSTLELNGDFDNSGTFNHNSGTIDFVGTSLVKGSATTTFNNIIISSTLYAHATQMNVAGNFTNNGTFSHNGALITFNGNSTVAGSALTNLNNVTISGNLTAHSGSMRIAGNIVNNGTFNSNAGTINFNGSTAISGTSSTSLANVTIWGTLTAPSGTLGLTQNWENDGTFANNSGTVLINGGTTQYLAGVHTTDFNNLAVSSSTTALSSGTINIANTISVEGGSTLGVAEGGILAVGATNTVNGNLTVYGGGNLQVAGGKTLTSGSAGTFTAQAGAIISSSNATDYNLVLAGATAISGTSSSAVLFSGAHVDLASSGGNSVNASNFRMNDISVGGTYLTISGSDWGYYTIEGAGFEIVGGNEVTVRITNSGTVTMNNYIAEIGYLYGDDTDEDSGTNGASGIVTWASTPVMLKNFEAFPSEEGVVVEWRTMTEQDNAGFRILRRAVKDKKNVDRKPDGDFYSTWTVLNGVLIDGANGSTFAQNYSYTDKTAVKNESYQYAIIDVDLAGNPHCRHLPASVTNTIGSKYDITLRPVTKAESLQLAGKLTGTLNPTSALGSWMANAFSNIISKKDSPSKGKKESILEAIANSILGNNRTDKTAIRRSVKNKSIDLILAALPIPLERTNKKSEQNDSGNENKTRDDGAATTPVDPNHYRESMERYWNKRKVEKFTDAFARIETKTEGLYKIGPAKLKELGFDLSKRFALYNRDVKVPCWRIAADNEDGFVLAFYAPEYRTFYSTTNVFWLRQLKKGAMAIQPASLAVAESPALSEHVSSVRYEDNLFLALQLVNSSSDEDHWFCSQRLRNKRTVTFPLNLSEVVADKAGKLQIMARSQIQSTPSTWFTININGVKIGEASWDGARKYLVETEIPAGVLVDGTNYVSLTSLNKVPGVEYTLFDWVNIDYTRNAVAINDAIKYAHAGETSKAACEGFMSPELLAVDITDQYAGKFIQTSAKTDDGEYTASFDAADGHTVFVSTVDNLLEPDYIEKSSAPRDLSLLRCQYLIIYADVLEEGALAFAEYHKQQSRQVECLSLSEALDIGYGGIYDPQAIEKVIKAAQPEYVLLVGEMTYDYHANFVDDVAYSIPAPFTVSHDFLCVTDYGYTTAVDGTMPTVAVGRIPARSSEEVITVLDKVKARDVRADGTVDLVLAADDNSIEFKRACESASAFAKGNIVKSYISDAGIASAKLSLLEGWNASPRAVFFAGHGSSFDWTADGLFGRSDISTLINDEAPPVVIQLDCLGSSAHLWDASGQGCLAENLIFAAGKGASSVIGSASFTSPKGQAILGTKTIEYMKEDGATVGQSFLKAQKDLAENGSYPEVLDTFLLIGDPASR
ncbi:MAG: hypothetical protein JXR97_16040 [Planctomycetes bacterium]|nr:hypothetical protein [Planctomycetota bacterium]